MTSAPSTERSRKKVIYSSPYIPAEWIAAHGLEPNRMACLSYDRSLFVSAPVNVEAGVCPYMRGFINQASSDTRVQAIILTTTCDQMRRGADLISLYSHIPCFLMHVPASWETSGVNRLFLRELERLGEFLVSLGGVKPQPDELAATMRTYDEKRKKLMAQQGMVSGKDFAQKLACFAETGNVTDGREQYVPGEKCIPVGFIGSPLTGNHFDLFDVFSEYGASVAFNATETGERVLPARFDLRRLKDEPMHVLAESYFSSFPDIGERPNNRIFMWMKDRVRDHHVRGVVLIRYMWCDKWHAEAQRFRESLSVPLLDIEIDGEQIGERTRNRIQAFMEGLR